MGFVFKSGFILPMNSSDFWAILAEPFNLQTHPITNFNKRSINENDAIVNGFDSQQNEKFERYQVKAEIVESGTEEDDNSDFGKNVASTRWLLYKGLSEIAER